MGEILEEIIEYNDEGMIVALIKLIKSKSRTLQEIITK